MGVLDSHVSVVIGGTSGIGARVAGLGTAEGATVVIVGRRRREGEELAGRLGRAASFVAADVTREHEVVDGGISAGRLASVSMAEGPERAAALMTAGKADAPVPT